MKRKCSNCGKDITDSELKLCPSCGHGLPDSVAMPMNLTHEQEVKIAERVAKALDDSKKFKNHIIKGLINRALGIIGIALIFIGGSYIEGIRLVNEKVDKRLKQLDNDTSNKIASVQYNIETNIEAQFKDRRIKEIVENVAANQASNLLLQQINPQIELFRARTSNTLAAFSASLATFEKDSTNALKDVRNATELSTLVAKANADDFNAFHKLMEMATSDTTSESIKLTAFNTVMAISSRMDIESIPNPLVGYQWSLLGLDESKSSFDDFKTAYSNHQYATDAQEFIITSIYNNDRFGKRDRMDFIANVMQTSDSILLRSRAIYLLDSDVHSHKGIAQIQWYLEWWNAHKDQYNNDIPKAH